VTFGVTFVTFYQIKQSDWDVVKGEFKKAKILADKRLLIAMMY